MNKLVQHKPKIASVLTVGPLRCCVLVYGQIVFRGIPTVVNSRVEKRKADKREQGRLATKRCRALKKNRNPVTKRIDPVSIVKTPLPYSVLKDIDAAAIKKLEDNPYDANGRPISFEEARALVIADSVKKTR